MSRYPFFYLAGVKSPDARRGFALLAVFWISLLLGILALNYATTARLNAEAALNRRLGAERDFILEAAFARGYHEYLKYRANRFLLRKKKEFEEVSGQPLKLWFPRAEPWSCSIEGVAVKIKIMDESGKFSLSGLRPELLRKIVAACGVDDEEKRDTVVDSILDWIDSDSLHRLNGAESDWYEDQGLEYGCKNRPIDVVDELLLIRGITPELYAGGGGRPGLVDFLSPYGGDAGRVDINSCAPSVFSLVEGLPAEVVQDIISKRREKPIARLAELSEIVPAEYFSLLQRYFTVSESGYVRIAVGFAAADGTRGWTSRVFPAGSRAKKN